MAEEFEEVFLTDILAEETDEKPETYTPEMIEESVPKQIEAEPPASVSSPAYEEHQAPRPTKATPQLAVEKERKVSAEQTAEALVDMINMANKSIFMPIRGVKAKKKIPKDVLAVMEITELKQLRGEALNDAEKKSLVALARYEKKLDTIRRDVPFSKAELEELKPATIAMAKKHGWEITETVWFVAKIGELFSKRIIDMFLE